MSRFHIDTAERVPIYEIEDDAASNCIVIRARMSIEIAGRVSSELMQLGADNKPALQVGGHVMALLLHNVLDWSGPDFAGLPCTPANIRALPMPESDPFIEKVANAIGERNVRAASPKKELAAPNISEKYGAADSTASPVNAELPSHLLGNGTFTSPLHSVIIGRRDK